MPRLVKGGKYVFGWTRVGETGRIVVPPEALAEYGLRESASLVLVPGSRTSGGLGLGSLEALSRSRLAGATASVAGPGESRAPEGDRVEHEGGRCCRVEVRDGAVVVPPPTLERFGVRVGDDLLVVRGSGLAVGFVVRGRVVEEARRHEGLARFES